MKTGPSAALLSEMETISTAQADDLKLDTGNFRYWLSRCTVADGEPYDNKVTIEELIDGRWIKHSHYQG